MPKNENQIAMDQLKMPELPNEVAEALVYIRATHTGHGLTLMEYIKRVTEAMNEMRAGGEGFVSPSGNDPVPQTKPVEVAKPKPKGPTFTEGKKPSAKAKNKLRHDSGLTVEQHFELYGNYDKLPLDHKDRIRNPKTGQPYSGSQEFVS